MDVEIPRTRASSGVSRGLFLSDGAILEAEIFSPTNNEQRQPLSTAGHVDGARGDSEAPR